MAIWALAGWGGDLDKAPIAIGRETSPAEVCRQTKGAVEPLGEHALRGIFSRNEFKLKLSLP